MNKTTKREEDEFIAIDIERLSALLSCGRATARKIGEQAGAKIVVGRRVLYFKDKVRDYLEKMTE